MGSGIVKFLLMLVAFSQASAVNGNGTMCFLSIANAFIVIHSITRNPLNMPIIAPFWLKRNRF